MSRTLSRCSGSSSAGTCARLYLLDFALFGETALNTLDGCVGEDIILLVSDINMPGMNGLDLLPKVKERRPGLPVFMISAYGDADMVSTARERGADEFLTNRWISPSRDGTSWR
jgi:DNA-binding NtrC family response regulator